MELGEGNKCTGYRLMGNSRMQVAQGCGDPHTVSPYRRHLRTGLCIPCDQYLAYRRRETKGSRRGYGIVGIPGGTRL